MSLDVFLKASKPYLADGGLETYLIFEDGLELPFFASFTLLGSPEGEQAMREYFARFAGSAKRAGTGFMLDTATWRANMGWAHAMGLSDKDIIAINKNAVVFAQELADEYRRDGLEVVLNGAVGPSGDGYAPDRQLSVAEAQRLHEVQINALAEAGVEMITAVTMTHSQEAIGVALAAKTAGVPVAISFTVETDGKLPSGESLDTAIDAVETAMGGDVLYYMVNCAHPDHFADQLALSGRLKRIGGIRANASRMSHAELDEAEELDAGNPEELGHQYADLMALLPGLKVVGGCCGTDHRHIGCIAHHLHAAA